MDTGAAMPEHIAPAPALAALAGPGGRARRRAAAHLRCPRPSSARGTGRRSRPASAAPPGDPSAAAFWIGGLVFSLPVLAILGAHELGPLPGVPLLRRRRVAAVVPAGAAAAHRHPRRVHPAARADPARTRALRHRRRRAARRVRRRRAAARGRHRRVAGRAAAGRRRRPRARRPAALPARRTDRLGRDSRRARRSTCTRWAWPRGSACWPRRSTSSRSASSMAATSPTRSSAVAPAGSRLATIVGTLGPRRRVAQLGGVGGADGGDDRGARRRSSAHRRRRASRSAAPASRSPSSPRSCFVLSLHAAADRTDGRQPLGRVGPGQITSRRQLRVLTACSARLAASR